MKIAAFDSGVGGLIALAPLLKKFNGLEVTYLGDLANLPYGTKSPQRIQDLTAAGMRYLVDSETQPFDLLLLACNTASSHALQKVKAEFRDQAQRIEGVIESSCETAIECTENNRIVIVATPATVKSQVYPETLKRLGFRGECLQISTPLFVSLVESEFEGTPAAHFAAQFYLGTVLKPQDTVILGCTHYPLLKSTLQKEFPEVKIWIEAGEALVRKLNFKDTPGRNHLDIRFTDTTCDHATLDRLFTKLKITDHTSFDLKCINPLF